MDSINQYLSGVYTEAIKRGYHFNRNKIDWNYKSIKIPVTSGQVEYETSHLLKKLKMRDLSRYNYLIHQKELLTHPIFEIINGVIEEWEVVK